MDKYDFIWLTTISLGLRRSRLIDCFECNVVFFKWFLSFCSVYPIISRIQWEISLLEMGPKSRKDIENSYKKINYCFYFFGFIHGDSVIPIWPNICSIILWGVFEQGFLEVQHQVRRQCVTWSSNNYTIIVSCLLIRFVSCSCRCLLIDCWHVLIVVKATESISGVPEFSFWLFGFK